MGSFCRSPTPPPAPDPTVVANAQSASNIATAQEQQRLNMVGQSTPQGTVNWQADPNSPGGYRQVTTYSPGEQGVYDRGINAQTGALDVANQQIGRVGDALGKGLTSPTLQTSFDQGGPIAHDYASGGPVQTGFDQGGPLQYGFNAGQQVQGDIGPQNLMGAYKNAADASYGQATSRLDPQYQQQQRQLETQLANQGLSLDSDAYKQAMDTFNRGRNDAYNQANFSAQNQGLTAENTLFGQSAQQGQFHNAAAGQQYSQNQGQAAFNNQTAGQAYGQNLGAMQAYNSAQAQQDAQNQGHAAFGNTAAAQQYAQNQGAAQFGNQAMGQQFQQDAYSQQLPINEFNSLMSNSQVSAPQGFGYSASQVNPTDVLGAYALNSQVANQGYQAQMQSRDALLGGMAQLGGAAIKAYGSDIRLKRDIELIGREADGLGVYEYEYIEPERWGHGRRVGVMAQEAQVLRPHAVFEMPGGFLAVDYRVL